MRENPGHFQALEDELDEIEFQDVVSGAFELDPYATQPIAAPGPVGGLPGAALPSIQQPVTPNLPSATPPTITAQQQQLQQQQQQLQQQQLQLQQQQLQQQQLQQQQLQQQQLQQQKSQQSQQQQQQQHQHQQPSSLSSSASPTHPVKHVHFADVEAGGVEVIGAGGARGDRIPEVDEEGGRYDILFCRMTGSNNILYIGYRRIVLYTTLACWFVAAWLIGIAYFVSGGGQSFLWWVVLTVLTGDLLSTALAIADRIKWHERYVDVVWYGMSFIIMLIPAAAVIAAAWQTGSYAYGLISTSLIMVLVPMAYTYVEAIVRCVIHRLGSTRYETQ